MKDMSPFGFVDDGVHYGEEVQPFTDADGDYWTPTPQPKFW